MLPFVRRTSFQPSPASSGQLSWPLKAAEIS
jgi:hypothetical protein